MKIDLKTSIKFINLILPFFLIFLIPFSSFATQVPSYKEILKKYHRHGESYSLDTFHAHFVWDVVYQNEEFQEVLQREYDRFYPSEQILKEGGVGPRFLVSFFTYRKKWNDLDSKDSLWRLTLKVGDRIFSPEQITTKKLSPKQLAFYPFVSPWAEIYEVSFDAPLAEFSEKIQLELEGIKGKSVLQWR